MGYVVLVLLIFMSLVGYYKYRNMHNPMTLFFGYWALLIFLELLQLFTFNSLSTETYFIFLAGFISIFLGLCSRRIRIAKKSSSINVSHSFNDQLLIIINVILLAFILYRVFVLLQMLASGRTWMRIRFIASGNEEGDSFLAFWGSNAIYKIYTYIVAPIIYMEAAVFVTMAYNAKYRNVKLLIIMAVNFVLFSVMTVSRNLMSFLIIYFVIGFFIYKKNTDERIRKTLKRLRKLIPILVVALIAGIWRISSLRNVQENIFETLYIYMVGGLPGFEYRINNFNYPEFTLGLYTFRGFIRPISSLLRIIGLSDTYTYQIASQIAADCEIYIPIGTNVRMNAYATIFYSLYRDGGIVGVILGSYAFGYFMKCVYETFIEKEDLRSCVIYFLIIQQIFFSMARFYFVFPSRAFSYIWAFLLLSSTNSSKRGKTIIGVM